MKDKKHVNISDNFYLIIETYKLDSSENKFCIFLSNEEGEKVFSSEINTIIDNINVDTLIKDIKERPFDYIDINVIEEKQKAKNKEINRVVPFIQKSFDNYYINQFSKVDYFIVVFLQDEKFNRYNLVKVTERDSSGNIILADVYILNIAENYDDSILEFREGLEYNRLLKKIVNNPKCKYYFLDKESYEQKLEEFKTYEDKLEAVREELFNKIYLSL